MLLFLRKWQRYEHKCEGQVSHSPKNFFIKNALASNEDKGILFLAACSLQLLALNRLLHKRRQNQRPLMHGR